MVFKIGTKRNTYEYGMYSVILSELSLFIILVIEVM